MEYSTHSLGPGLHPWKKFKDLFRGSIKYDEYTSWLAKASTEIPAGLQISSMKYRAEGNYQACYVVLNVLSLNFELKVVSSLDDIDESHGWYELARNNSLENLESFISRGIAGGPSCTIDANKYS